MALDANDTWDLVDPPQHCKPIGCKWVYKVKYNTDSLVNRYKARLVAKGFEQTHDIDYDETFAPVAKMTTVRVVFTLVPPRGCHLHQIDVKNVFLQGDLEERVVMVQPLRFQSELNKLIVCRLKKSLYSLKQAPHTWNSKITQQLHKMGFEVSKFDSSLFI